jgi:hypothetical protein
MVRTLFPTGTIETYYRCAVTNLGDWGYPETTIFIDPMEQKYRAKDVNSADFEEGKIQEKLQWFYLMDAYKDPHKVEEALASYWANGGKPASKTTLSTSTIAASSSTKPPSSTRPAPTTKPVSSTRASSTRAPSTTTRRPTSTKELHQLQGRHRLGGEIDDFLMTWKVHTIEPRVIP